MSSPETSPNTLRPQEEYLGQYDALRRVLSDQSPHLLAGAHLFAKLVGEPDGALLTAAAEFAFGQSDEEDATDVPGVRAHEALPAILHTLRDFTVRQKDLANTGSNVRWTSDWDAIAKEIQKQTEADPNLNSTMHMWFVGDGRELVETTYAPDVQNGVYFTVGGANFQGKMRAVLTLASLAGEDFRQQHGLATRRYAGLDGEDHRDPNWLMDDDFTAVIRQKVVERIRAGEISPRILVGGSMDGRRILKGQELTNVSSLLIDGVPLLFGDGSDDSTVTEADGMLAGAIATYGGDVSTLHVRGIPGLDEASNKIITFESQVGPITLVATSGNDAKMRGQLMVAKRVIPGLFDGADAIVAATTAIYLLNHGALLSEAAHGLGIDASTAIGLSAHASNLTRKTETLVGELLGFYKAMNGVVDRMLTAAEVSTRIGVQQLGGAAIQGAGQ